MLFRPSKHTTRLREGGEINRFRTVSRRYCYLGFIVDGDDVQGADVSLERKSKLQDCFAPPLECITYIYYFKLIN